MTFDECHDQLVRIRRQQGTRHPKLRVDSGGQVFRGRLARADSDPEFRPAPLRPTGALVLEDLKAGRKARIVLPLERIEPEGIRELDNDAD